MTLEREKRIDRKYEFSHTIDKMNPVWYAALSDTDKTAIATWRSAWLAYPTDDSATRPAELSIFEKCYHDN